MTLVRAMLKELGEMTPRAEIHQTPDGTYEVHYYSVGTTTKPFVERYAGKSFHYAESAASNWLDGIKALNG